MRSRTHRTQTVEEEDTERCNTKIRISKGIIISGHQKL